MERELSHIIQEEILERGPITFQDFMEMTLYYPELGYYTSGKQSIGRGGDYYTSLCYYKHTVNDNPYQHIGEQDITSHVNFSALMHWGEKAGLETTGFTDQAHFLINLGLLDRMQELQRETKDYQDYLKKYLPLKNLIAPGGMGEAFKVLIQHKGIKNPHLTGLGSDPDL